MVRKANEKPSSKKAPTTEAKGGKTETTEAKGTTAQTKDPSEKTGYQIKGEGYVPSKTASGGKSYHSGDETARMLEGKSLDEVYALAAKHTGVDENELREKYANLKNDGLRRMTLGNRIRGALNKKAKEAEKAAAEQ